MGKESRMRNDVKLGLAVGSLLLGVVLAYALFVSNTNKDRKDLAEGGYSALDGNNTASGQKPLTASNTDQTAADSNPPTNSSASPATADHKPGPVADSSTANPLIGKSWQLLLNEGATANTTAAITPSPDRSAGTVRNTPTPPSRDSTTLAEPPPAPTGPRRYTNKHGDTYWSIARAEYGNAAYFGHIQR